MKYFLATALLVTSAISAQAWGITISLPDITSSNTSVMCKVKGVHVIAEHSQACSFIGGEVADKLTGVVN